MGRANSRVSASGTQQTRLKNEYLEEDGVRFLMEDEAGSTAAVRIGYGGPGRIYYPDLKPEPTHIRLVRVNENGKELTAEEACALRHTLPGQQSRKEEENQDG